MEEWKEWNVTEAWQSCQLHFEYYKYWNEYPVSSLTLKIKLVEKKTFRVMVTALLGVGTETTKILVWVRIRTLLKQPTLIVGLVWEVNRLWKLCVWVIHLSRIHLPITAFILSLVPLLVLRRLSGLLFTPGWGTNMASPSGSNGVWYALAWYWAGQLLQVIKCLKSDSTYRCYGN